MTTDMPRILLVEDEPAHAELVQRAFEMSDRPVLLTVAGTLAEARTHLAVGAARLSLVIADWRLPDGESIELLTNTPERRDVPVVIMTSHGNERVAVEAMKAGALDYVVKSETILLDMPHIAGRAIREWNILAERTRMERDLRESEARFRLLAENSLDMIARHDAQGQCLYVSPACRAMLGYEPEDLVGQPSTVIVHPDDLDHVIRSYITLIQRSGPGLVSFRAMRKDGQPTWLEATSRAILDQQTGAVIEIQSALRDITQRRKAGEEIQRLNHDLERRATELAALNRAGQIMTSTLDLETLMNRVIEQALVLLDAEGTSVLLCDQATRTGDCGMVFAAAAGPGADKLVGRRLDTEGIATWALREQHSALIQDVHSDPRWYNAIDADTGVTTRSLMAVPLASKGNVIGVIEAINKNIGSFDGHDLALLEALASSAAIAIENAQLYASEHERAAALARALEQQRELDRLQREFIQNVSHELRTPLALVRGHAELLEAGWLGELNAEQLQSVTVILRRSEMLSKLVDDIVGILTIEKKGLKREPLDLSQMIHTLLTEFKTAAEKNNLGLSAEIEPELPRVMGDGMALRRALDNLVSNAVKFTPAGGSISVRLSRAAQFLALQVTDTGIGIPEDKQARIFERFYQVDGSATRKYGGVGLGLALVKEIVEAHGGQIAVTSQLNTGTTFSLLLPLG
jgi:PAS domain S-box-containing protein